jgi:hypothetical protein
MLKLYSIHATQSSIPKNRPDYFMQETKAYAMTSDTDTLRKGAGFRSLRDYAVWERKLRNSRGSERIERIDQR